MNANLKLDGKCQYYPTPVELADKMVNSITRWNDIKTVLEPSAGTGSLIKSLLRAKTYQEFQIDCLEIQPELRGILKEQFEESSTVPKIIGDDFLSFNTFKSYDLILMNPPFSEGDKHLLKAIDMQKNGGTIVCLLNAETIKNPYSNDRKYLVSLLDKYNADIECIENGFVNADNSTAVEVALIKVFIPTKSKTDSEILKSLEKGEKVPDFDFKECSLDVTDFIKSAINKFNFEVRVGLKLLQEYESLKPYMLSSFQSSYEKPILEFNDSVTPNEYVKKVRHKYWEALLCSQKFIGKMPSNLQDKYINEVNELSNYDFSEFNIKNLSIEMASKLKEFIESKIMELFDEFTREHTWFEGCTDTIHFYNGWKTNKANKVDKKVIMFCYGAYDKVFKGYTNVLFTRKFDDIIKVLNYLNGSSEEFSTYNIIEQAGKEGKSKNIDCKYFYISIFKKGTIHLTFKDEYLPLIDRLNIFAGKRKNWLPPSYGKVKYKDMSREEKEIVDSFQGEEKYNQILQNANYYLAPVCADSNLLLLEG